MKQKISQWMERATFLGTCGLLGFAPLAFGSVHVWAYSVIIISVFTLLWLLMTSRLLGAADKLSWVRTPVNGVVPLILMIVVFQVVPLPASWVAVLSPEAYSDRMATCEILAASGDAAMDGYDWFPVGYGVHPALREGLKLAAYGGMFLLILGLAASRRRIDILVNLLIAIGLFEAIYGIWQVFAQDPTVWWWPSRAGGGRFASGTFIGSNHFGFYVEMVVALGLGAVIARKQRMRRFLPAGVGVRAFLQRIVAYFSPESSQPRRVLLFFVAGVMGLALLLSASRGGILSAGAATFIMALLFLSRKRFHRYGILALALCGFSVIYGLHVGIDPTLSKFEQVEGLENRLAITEDILPMLRDYPLTGVGWGNFRHLYPRYIDDRDRVSNSGYSHNDWVEAGIELGVGGLALILLGFFAYLYRTVRVWRRRHDFHAVGIGAGVIAALLSVGFHSFFDFSLHIPANPLTLAALMAVGYAALHRTDREYRETFFYRVRSVRLTTARRVGIAVVVTFFCGVAIFAAVRHLMAESACPTEWNSTLRADRAPYLTEIERAARLNPVNDAYVYRLADYYSKIRISDPAVRREYQKRTEAHFRRAIRLNPARASYWYGLGRVYAGRREDPYAHLNRWLPRADRCFDMALRCAPKDPGLLFNVAWYWVGRSRMLPEGDPTEGGGPTGLSREAGIRRFQELFRRGLALQPKRWQWAMDRIWEHYPSDKVVLGMVDPEDAVLRQQVLRRLAEWTPSEVPDRRG